MESDDISRTTDGDRDDGERTAFSGRTQGVHERHALQQGLWPEHLFAYHSDLNIWSEWLGESEVDWVQATHTHMEQFIAWQMRTRGVKAHIISRRSSCLSTFYKWCLKHEVIFSDPTCLAAKPKRPQRIPVWLEREEQEALEQAVNCTDDLPEDIFGRKREHIRRIRERYRMLFLLILNSGLRISEALKLTVRDRAIALKNPL